MRNRKDEILEKGREILDERFKENEKEIFTKYKTRIENNIKELSLKIEKFIELNYKGEEYKNKIKYIGITYLKSSILTRSYDFAFSLYEEDFYIR